MSGGAVARARSARFASFAALAAWALAALLAAPGNAAAQAIEAVDAIETIEADGAAAPPERDPALDLAQEMYREALQSLAEGRKQDASAALARVLAKEPLHAGAWLDLALIQCSLGHADEAERLFTAIIERFAPPEGIMELIANARAEGCSSWRPQSQTTLSLSRGIDQNVNQGTTTSTFNAGPGGAQVELPLTDDFKPRHDQYTSLSAEYLRDLTANGSTVYGQLQWRRNDALNLYDSASLFVGVETPWRFGRWTVRGSATAGWVTLGGQYYQRQTQAQVRIGPPLPLPRSIQFNLLAGLTHINYLTLSNFDGNLGEVRGQFSYRNELDYASASVGWQSDRATGARPGGDRHGLLATATWRRRLGTELVGEIGHTYQRWRGASFYSPGFIEQVRDQATQVTRIVLTYPVSKQNSIQLEARHIRNKENISIFQYNNRQLQLTWQWQGL